MSLVEAITNVVAGYLLALLTQITIFPLFGLAVSVADNLIIGCIFTAVSVVRSFTLRRLFEAVRARHLAVDLNLVGRFNGLLTRVKRK